MEPSPPMVLRGGGKHRRPLGRLRKAPVLHVEAKTVGPCYLVPLGTSRSPGDPQDRPALARRMRGVLKPADITTLTQLLPGRCNGGGGWRPGWSTW